MKSVIEFGFFFLLFLVSLRDAEEEKGQSWLAYEYKEWELVAIYDGFVLGGKFAARTLQSPPSNRKL